MPKSNYAIISEHDSYVHIYLWDKFPKGRGSVIKDFEYAIVDNVLVATGEKLVWESIEDIKDRQFFIYETDLPYDVSEDAMFPDDIWDDKGYVHWWHRWMKEKKKVGCSCKYSAGYYKKETDSKKYIFTNFIIDDK